MAEKVRHTHQPDGAAAVAGRRRISGGFGHGVRAESTSAARSITGTVPTTTRECPVIPGGDSKTGRP